MKNINAALGLMPDVATHAPHQDSTLDWVGMERIEVKREDEQPFASKSEA